MSTTGTKPASESRLLGRGASEGWARGRIVVLRASSDPRAEEADAVDLPTAIGIALTELRELQRTADETAAQILEFQAELLNDPELVADAAAAIDNGERPSAAFRDAMQAHVRHYEEAASEYLRERAADIRDLRDRVLRAFGGEHRAVFDPPDEEDALLLADDLTPSAFVELDLRRVKGIAIRGGSPMSHVAMMARARGVPLIVGLHGIEPRLEPGLEPALAGREALLDGGSGCLLIEPSEPSLAAYRASAAARSVRSREERSRASAPAVTPDGRRIAIYVNVDSIDSLALAPPEWFDGIGLARTELLLDCASGAPDEGTQVDVYAKLFDWSDGRPTTIRLLDAGGDKPVPGLTEAFESNPFLGVRGVRALLRNPKVLRTQLRAIVRAAAGRATRILVPMVTIPREMANVRAELQNVLRDLDAEGGAVRLGMMVETPAAALTIEQFDAADFFSIGTNDLLQYLMAASRDCAGLEHLHVATGAALLEAVRRIVAHAERRDAEISVCGDAAADVEGAVALVRTGVSALSVPARNAPAVKAAIRGEAATG